MGWDGRKMEGGCEEDDAEMRAQEMEECGRGV